jgi:hypothetical protein
MLVITRCAPATTIFQYLFGKRLAVNPLTGQSLNIFEWSKMPKGFRWF